MSSDFEAILRIECWMTIHVYSMCMIPESGPIVPPIRLIKKPSVQFRFPSRLVLVSRRPLVLQSCSRCYYTIIGVAECDRHFDVYR